MKARLSDDVEAGHDDEGEEEGGEEQGDDDVVVFAADDGEGDAEGDADEVRPDLRVGGVAECHVSTRGVEGVARRREAEYPAVVAVVVGFEVARVVAFDVGQDHSGGEVHGDGREQQEEEGEEIPVRTHAQLVDAPPPLHLRHKDERGPDEREPVEAHARTLLD